MKRSASDAGIPPAPRQLHISAIPAFNPPAIQLPPPPPPAPLPPTIATVQRSPVAIWPQPHPTFFTFLAHQTYPPLPLGLPAIPAPAFHDMQLARLAPSSNSSSKSLQGSSGRYARSQVAEKTELTVKLATPADLSELADTLRQQTKVSKININTRCPRELKAAFDAIRTSLSVLDVVVHFEGPLPERGVLNDVFSSLQAQQAPIKSFQWIGTQADSKPQKIDQFVFEALLTSQLLERIHFSVPRSIHPISMHVTDAKQLALCIAKHQSLKSLSFTRIIGTSFIDATLKGVADSLIIKEMHFNMIDLTSNTIALKLAVSNNKQLRSISIKDCLLEFGLMTQILKSVKDHPALESLDFKTAKIPAEELQLIGEPIGELLLTNSRINALCFRCTLSPVNIAALRVGLAPNTSLAFLAMDALEDAQTSVTHRTETDTSHNLDDMFLLNKGLREIVIRLPASKNGTDDQILQAITKSPSIESLTIENIFEIQKVSNLLADNPRIKHLKLKIREIEIGERYTFAQTVHQLAENLNDNKNLLSFSLALHPRDDRKAMKNGSFGNINENIRRIDVLTTRNRVRAMAPLAGAVMSSRQHLSSNMPGALPTLPAEINQLLFEAAVNYISPNDAPKLYDTVLPFTPLPGNQ